MASFLLVMAGSDLRLRRRILETPTSRIIDAPAKGIVEIQGRIVASEQGVVRAPFSGRDAVWYCGTILEQSRNSFHRRHTESDGRLFYVDDGSGEMAKIVPDGASILVDEKIIASPNSNDVELHKLEALLPSRGLSERTRLGFRRALRYDEAILKPGDHLYALGPARRKPASPGIDTHRVHPNTELVLFQGKGPTGQLVLTNDTEKRLIRQLDSTLVFGVILAVLGATLITANFLLH